MGLLTFKNSIENKINFEIVTKSICEIRKLAN